MYKKKKSINLLKKLSIVFEIKKYNTRRINFNLIKESLCASWVVGTLFSILIRISLAYSVKLECININIILIHNAYTERILLKWVIWYITVLYFSLGLLCLAGICRYSYKIYTDYLVYKENIHYMVYEVQSIIKIQAPQAVAVVNNSILCEE